MTPRTSAATALLLVALTAGCSNPGSDDAGAASMADSAAGGNVAPNALEKSAAARDGADSEGSGGDSSGDRTSARVLPSGADIVYRGEITVRVRNVARAVSRAEHLAQAAEGVVFSAETSRASGSGEANLTLRVPPTQFASTLASLGRLGTELHRTRSATDVTTELADTGSRVRSQERSINRLRSLLDEADTIGEVVQVESELARREADLESLQAQLARLQDVTDMATIEVALLSRDAPAPPRDDDELGFASGLRGGWDAFVGIVLVALTVLGALVPFAIAVGILGVPAYVLLRSRRRTLTPGTPPATTPDATA